MVLTIGNVTGAFVGVAERDAVGWRRWGRWWDVLLLEELSGREGEMGLGGDVGGGIWGDELSGGNGVLGSVFGYHVGQVLPRRRVIHPLDSHAKNEPLRRRRRSTHCHNKT